MTTAEKLKSPKRWCIFVRDDGWYPLELPEATITDNAQCNPCVQHVIDAITGETIWPNDEMRDRHPQQPLPKKETL